MQIPTRTVRYRELTFDQWVETQENLRKEMIFSSEEYANAMAMVVMGMPGNPTRRTQGKIKASFLKIKYTQAAMRDYLATVPEKTKEIPLDPTKIADQAYVRVIEKRRIRQEKHQDKS